MVRIFSQFVLLSWIAGAVSFAAMGGGTHQSLVRTFVEVGQSLPEAEIHRRLHAARDQQDLLSFAREEDSLLTASTAHKMGLQKVAKMMIGSGPFSHNYQKMILSALLDFKHYALYNDPFSLKGGERAPVLFDYRTVGGREIAVTTYSFTCTILEQLDHLLTNGEWETMGRARLLSFAQKVRGFLEELSKGAPR